MKEIKDNRSYSLTYLAWKKMRKDKLAMFGFYTIVFFIALAIFGYTITPDSTPDSNDQMLELSVKPPGFSVNMLKIKKNEPSHGVNFFTKMVQGEVNDFIFIPFTSYAFDGVDIVIKEYTGDSKKNPSEKRYNMADVVFAINKDMPIHNNIGSGYIEFYEFNTNSKIRKNINELKTIIEKNNITKRTFMLGSDIAGRDLLSRLIIGTRVSFSVGFISVFISLVIGVLLGAFAGYYRGWVDDVIVWLINVVWSIPTLLLVIAITLALGKGFWQVFVAVGLTMWVEVARVVRGQIMSLREKEFVEAAKALGFSDMRIIFKHIVPNVFGPIIVISAANFASAILIEAGLSFLGIGAQPPTASWGAMISSHRAYIIGDTPYLAFLPGIAIMLIVLAFVLLGNGLRDALDAQSVDEDKLIY